MTTRPLRRHAASRSLWTIVVIVLLAGCGSPSGSTTPSAGTAGSPAVTIGAATPGSSFASSGAPSGGPTVAPPTLNEGFQYSDILKITVNRLAVRAAPRRSAPLVHGYNLSGPAPIDYGLIRLNKGDFVSVHLGPIKVRDTTWYLVWPAEDAKLHESSIDWYTGEPGITAGGPGWMAAQVGDDLYMTLHRRPSLEEIEEFLPLGLNVAGTGNYESPPQPRHDFFLFDWAVATPVADTSCDLIVSLVPADADFEPVFALSTSTSGVKVAPVAGVAVNAPWLPAPAGSWETFTVRVSGTCTWAIRLTPLHHD